MPHRPSVLIADDSKMTRVMVEKLLPSAGYRCFAVASARECLEVIDAVSFDAIITDLEMPGMSGFELLEELKSRSETANIPILVLTADQERETLQEAFSLRAADFLRKPVDKLELLARVRMATQMSIELKRRRDHDAPHHRSPRDPDCSGRQLS